MITVPYASKQEPTGAERSALSPEQRQEKARAARAADAKRAEDAAIAALFADDHFEFAA